MKREFELLRATRANVLNLINNSDPEELLTIPKPFNNHIMWNAGHLLATYQILAYASSNTPERIDRAFIEKYAKGTFPGAIDSEEIALIKTKLMTIVDQVEADFARKLFEKYEPRMTSYGVPLNSIEDAIQFLKLHEAMHFGQMKMIKKLIGQANP